MTFARRVTRCAGGRMQAGNAMIELALGWFIMTTVFSAAFEYGYVFYQYNSLFNAVNNGALYAAQFPYDSDSGTPNSNGYFTNSVTDMVLYGDPTGASTTTVLKGLTSSNVNIVVTGSGTASSTWYPSTMNVYITGYSINGIFGSYTTASKPNVTYPFIGNFIPPSS